MYPAYLVVMCRIDLPVDPFWRELGLPSPHCWDVDMFFDYALEVDGKYLEEAKRIYWEFFWRWKHHYKRGRPFPEFYICDNEEKECVPIPLTEKAKDWLIRYVVYSGTIRHVGVAKIPRQTMLYQTTTTSTSTTSFNIENILNKIIGVEV